MSANDFRLAGTAVYFNETTKNFEVLLSDAIMGEQEMKTMFDFGDALGSAQGEVCLTISLSINDVLDDIIEGNGLISVDVGQPEPDVEEMPADVKNQLIVMRDEMLAAVARINKLV
jgi:hypothetical protein